MSNKDDNVKAAREHYEKRKEGRPTQTWDAVNRKWVKS